MEYIIEEILKTLLLFSAILFVFGFISPQKSLFFLKTRKTRSKSAKIYGGISLVLLVVLFNIIEIDYYSKGISNFEEENFEKSIKEFKLVESQDIKFDSAQYYIQISELKISLRDSLIEIKAQESLEQIKKEEAKIKEEEAKRIKEEEEKVLTLFKDFSLQIDNRNNQIEKASKQASSFLRSYANGKASYQQTIQALDIAINICNAGMISIDNIPTEFNEPLEKKCIVLIRAYSSAYFERMMIFVSGKEGIEKQNSSSFDAASRFRDSYQIALLKAVALDIELRNEFGLKMPK